MRALEVQLSLANAVMAMEDYPEASLCLEADSAKRTLEKTGKVIFCTKSCAYVMHKRGIYVTLERYPKYH